MLLWFGFIVCSKVLPGEHWSIIIPRLLGGGLGGDFQVIETVLLRRPVGLKLSSTFHFGPQGDQFCTTVYCYITETQRHQVCMVTEQTDSKQLLTMETE